MALPSTAIEQIRRDPSRTPGWSGRLVMFSGTALFVVILAFVGLKFGYEPYLDKQIAVSINDQKKFSQEIPTDIQDNIVKFYSQITNIKSLLARHGTPSEFFDLLETKTLPNVYFEKLNLTASNREAQISGRAKTFQDFSSQIAIFQATPLISKVVVKTSTLDPQGLWAFDITLTIDPSFFGSATPATSTVVNTSLSASSSTTTP
jgi:hypothetical protein